MDGLGAGRREARLNADYEGVPIMSVRAYNTVMGVTVLYGLLMSMMVCVALMPISYKLVEHYPVIVVVYLISASLGCWMSAFSQSPVVSFIGYNLLVVPVGVVLAIPISRISAIGFELVIQAMLFTMIIVLCMIAIGFLNPGVFLGLRGILFTILLGMIASGVVCLIFRWDTSWQNWICVLLFSLYIGYDFQRSQKFEHTLDNAVDCALDIYLDVINLFLRVLYILSKSKSKGRS